MATAAASTVDRTLATRWFEHGRELGRNGRFRESLEALERALACSIDETDLVRLAHVRSWLGLAMAMNGGDLARARDLCEEAVYVHAESADLYLNLGRVLVKAGARDLGIACAETALALDGGNVRATAMMRELGRRRTPPFPFLARSNPINKYVGLLRHRLAQ